MNENNGKIAKKFPRSENKTVNRARSHAHRIEKRDSLKSKAASIRREMFSQAAIPAESKRIIENFDDIVADVRNLTAHR